MWIALCSFVPPRVCHIKHKVRSISEVLLVVALLSEDIYLVLKRLINLLAMAAKMKRVFPEALSPLLDCDPEVASIIKDEKARQW